MDRGTLKTRKIKGQRYVSQVEYDRVFGGYDEVYTQESVDANKKEITSEPDVKLPDTNDLLKERNLDPDEWEVTHVKVNEWDSPGGIKLKQLTVSARRKLQLVLPFAQEPSKYKAPAKAQLDKKGAELVVFAGDQQAPHHDLDLHRLFCDWLRVNKPARGILMGDTVDFGGISRHALNPEWDSTVQEGVNAGYLLLRDYVQASTNTRWTKLMGNHDERIRQQLLLYVRDLYGLRAADIPGEEQESPVWCVSNLLRLPSLDIEFLAPSGGYNHAQAKLSNHLAARHGWIARKGSGASALGTLEALGYSVVVGHTHRQSLVHKTTHDIDGTLSTLAAVETGCLCKIQDGLGYTIAPDWQNGFATASIWPDGTFKLDLATYVNGVLYWRDHRYS